MFDWFLAKLEKMLCRGSCCDHKVWPRLVTPYAVGSVDHFFSLPTLLLYFVLCSQRELRY